MTTNNNNPEHLPCTCTEREAYTDSYCPGCEDAMRDERERKIREYEQEAYANNNHFIAACEAMTPEDWDADNDWLASAGWGEM